VGCSCGALDNSGQGWVSIFLLENEGLWGIIRVSQLGSYSPRVPKKKKKPSGIGRDELWSSFQVPLSPSQHNSSASICFVNGFPCVKQKIIAKYLRKFWSRQL